MNWRNASRAQLVVIAYHDAGAPLQHIESAKAELKRRELKRYIRVNYRGKKIYPR